MAKILLLSVFLDADTQLYKPLFGPSVRCLVGWSICLSIHLLVLLTIHHKVAYGPLYLGLNRKQKKCLFVIFNLIFLILVASFTVNERG